MNHDIVILGASHANDNGVPQLQAVVPLTNDLDDVEPLGEIDSFQQLGVSALPWPKDKNGHCEAVILRNCGGKDAVVIGARDTRSSKIVGKLRPGDTVVHATGPQQAAQLQLKEEKRQAVLATKDSKGKTMLFVLDGTNDKAAISAGGHMFEMSREAGISIVDATGKAGILIKDGQVTIFGKVLLGGMTANPAMKLMLGLPTGSPGGVASIPLVAVKGVDIGM